MDKEAVQLYRLYGRLPDELWKQTPHQLFSVMFSRRAAGDGTRPLPPLEGLTKTNLLRAKKGLPPVMGKLFRDVLKDVPDAPRKR